jgi:CDP-glucose 4,6-dehydratase
VKDLSIFEGKTILLTGHTGFKGTWLLHILNNLGAKVIGISLPLGPENLFFNISAGESKAERNYYQDLRNFDQTDSVIQSIKPDYIFHLAAQPLVSRSYIDPLETITTNVVGTSNLIISALRTPRLKGMTIAATDKVYKQNSSETPFKEDDSLGGVDPYSASKAATEIIIKSLARSCNTKNVPITTIRAGNVIGGGDYAPNRLIPDICRSIQTNSVLKVRNKEASRPWQYISDCLSGYLRIAQMHLSDELLLNSSEYNIGPDRSIKVSEIIEIFSQVFPQQVNWIEEIPNFEETKTLALDSSLAQHQLNWHPKYSVEESVIETALWFKALQNGEDIRELIDNTIQKDFLN